MGYKLNCGIELTECDPYDSFIYEGHPHKLLYLGGKTHFDIEGKRQYMICQDGKEWDISKLKPTEETKRKVEAKRLHASGFTYIEHTESGAIKCKQGDREYLIPNKPMKIKEDVMDIPEFKLYGWRSKQAYNDHMAALFGKHLEIPAGRMKYPANEVENMLAAFNLGDKKPQDVPEVNFDMKSRTINESLSYADRMINLFNLEPEPLARIVDWRKNELVGRGDVAIQLDDEGVIVWAGPAGLIENMPEYMHVIRINTAAIPKQRTMTKAEVEREFGVKVVD